MDRQRMNRSSLMMELHEWIETIQQDIEKLQADAELYQRIVNELNHDRSSKDSGREEQILRYQ